MSKYPKSWPSRWQKFWFTIAHWWLKRNGFLVYYEDGYWPWQRRIRLTQPEAKHGVGDVAVMR